MNAPTLIERCLRAAGLVHHRPRMLIVSTPRTGNTWLRHLLVKLYGLHARPNGELAVHNPADVPWDDLPPRAILQLHWHTHPDFVARLQEHQFQTITLTRHPLDVLISILQLSQHTDETARWLEGEGGNEAMIHGATPRSKAFLAYAISRRANALLSVSREWWNSPGSFNVRYEDLVRAPHANVKRLVHLLGPVEPGRIDESIEACAIDRLRNPDNAPHFWQGQPGLWKSLLTADEALRIAAAHADVFSLFGYRCDPDLSLSPAQADANWAFLKKNPRKSSARSA